MFKKYYVPLVLAVLTPIIVSAPVKAQKQPIQIALFTPVQIIPEDNHIKGFRLNLVYGRNASVTGLDVGLINHSTRGSSKGAQFGLLGLVDSNFTGWQCNTVNITKGHFKGFQLGIVNYSKRVCGIQFGLVNYAVNINGLQIGLVNIIEKGGAFPVFPVINW